MPAGIGYAPMPLSIPDASGAGGIRGGGPLTGGGSATPDIDPIRGLPAGAGSTGTGGTSVRETQPRPPWAHCRSVVNELFAGISRLRPAAGESLALDRVWLPASWVAPLRLLPELA